MFSSHQLVIVERLSDRVGIIRDGSMVAVGDIESLRDTEERRWVVDGPVDSRWLDQVPEARLVEAAKGRTIVEAVDGHASDVDQKILGAALGAGPVREFSRLRPSLSELYRDVVRSDDQEASA
jgi:ABC-2 type transport system ATP-binding protein